MYMHTCRFTSVRATKYGHVHVHIYELAYGHFYMYLYGYERVMVYACVHHHVLT